MKRLTARHGLHGLAGGLLVVTIILASLTSAAAQAVGGLAGPVPVAAQVVESVTVGAPVEALILIDDADERAAQESESSLASLPDPVRMSPAQYAQRVENWARRLDAMKTVVRGEILGGDLDELSVYPQFPILHVRIKSPAALQRLRSHPKVISVDENGTSHLSLAQSLPLIGQPEAQAAGDSGSGATVCVLDTGVNYTHPAFGPCSAPGGACKVAYAADFAPDDGSLDAHGHGTNVSAIVLGAAPGARVAVLDVFEGDLAYTDDIIAAIGWCVTNKAAYNIASLNMSLGGGREFAARAPTDSWGVAIQSAVNAGIVVVAASGNDGYTSSLTLPAAYANVVSVGAVYDSAIGAIGWGNPLQCTDSTTAADKVTCFSNSASFLSMLAPGALITAAGTTMGGTSQAAPHVAGAAAVVSAANPGSSAGQVAFALANGPPVTDARNGIVKPRLYLPSALSLGVDTNPDPFSFTAQTGVALSTTATSNTITVSGIGAAAPISVSGGTYNVNGGGYTSAAGTVNNGNTVSVRLTSAAGYSTQTCATLTIGGVSGTFCVTTTAGPVAQPDLVMTNLQAPSTGVIGNQITASGTIANQGAVAAGPFHLAFYFSTDSTISKADTATLSGCSVPGLAAGSTWPCSGTVAVPASLTAGTYYFGAIIDDLGQVAESNEANNFRAADTGPIVLTAASTPTTTTLGSDVNPSTAGATVTFTAMVTGTAPTGTVGFTDGGATISGCVAVALTGSGNARTAACATSGLATGAHAITARYSGDATHQSSSSATLAHTVLAALPGTGTIVANPYGAMSVQGASLSGNTISNLQPNVTIQLGATAGTAGSYAKIDFQGFNWGPGTVLTIRSGAAGQKLVLYNALAAASSISGTLLAQGGNGAAPPAIDLWNPSGFAIGPGGTITAPSGLTLDALGNTRTTGQDIVNAGSIDGGSSLILHGANIKGGGAFKGNSTVVATFGSANNPVNGAHYLANALQLFPSTGSDLLLTLNDYGNAPQYINVKVNGNARLSMPSVWPNGSTLPPNNPPVAPGGVRPAGVPDPTYGAGSSIFQATGSMTLDKGTSNDFVFPGGIVLKAGGTLDLNGVIVNQGWTTNGQAFQGTYFEAPNIVSSAGNIQVLTNNRNWVNFSTMPHAPVRTWTLVRAADGSAQYVPADSVAPHLNTYSILIEAAAAGQCWVCLVNSLPVDMWGAPPPASVPVCSITPSQTVSAGTSVTLALANCSPGTGLAYSWNQDSPTGPQVSTGPIYTTPLLTTTANYFGTVSANGTSTTYQTTVTVNGPPAPPPVSGNCSGYTAVDLGDLSFDGRRIMTNGVTGPTVVYGRIVVPNPLPGGWSGKVSSIAVFEYLDPQYSKKMYVTKTPCDFSAVWPAYAEGNSINVLTSFQNPLYNAVNVNAGDVWYLTVKNERLNGAPSCANGASCNFAFTLSAPSAP